MKKRYTKEQTIGFLREADGLRPDEHIQAGREASERKGQSLCHNSVYGMERKTLRFSGMIIKALRQMRHLFEQATLLLMEY